MDTDDAINVIDPKHDVLALYLSHDLMNLLKNELVDSQCRQKIKEQKDFFHIKSDLWIRRNYCYNDKTISLDINGVDVGGRPITSLDSFVEELDEYLFGIFALYHPQIKALENKKKW
jgi:hypothetical protein